MLSRNTFLLLLLVAQASLQGSHASALPFSPTSTVATLKQKSQEQQTWLIETRGGADTHISRGGSSVAATAAEGGVGFLESLQLLGLVGALSSFQKILVHATQEWWKDAHTAKFLLAGAVAGIVSRTAVSPLEVVATAQMVRGGNKGMLGELTELYKTEGVRGFFKGNAANCIKVAPTRGVQFFAFETFKKQLVEIKRRKQGKGLDDVVQLTPIERLIAGGFAGMIASSMVYPIEVVKTMLTMYPGKYAGIGAAFRGVLAEVGPKGLYAGLPPTLIAMFPYVGVEFMIYETSKIAIEALMNRRQSERSNGKRHDPVVLPIVISLGLGAMAGAAAQTSAHPLDVVRKRLQVQGINGNPVLYKNTFDCFSGVARKEGFGALYRGLGPACVATIPGTGIAYITYEFMKKFLQLTSV